jgi:hypothetical protein
MGWHLGRRRVFIAASGMLAIVGTGAALNQACQRFGESTCRNEVLDEHVSPDGKLKVVVFQRDCGATTGFSTQASIVGAREAVPKGSGGLFVADTDRGAAPAGNGGGPELRVRWLDARRVVLSHHTAAQVFKADLDQNGVEVVFERFQ